MYYIAEIKYAGANPDQHADDGHTFEIRTSPIYCNSSGVQVIDGWAGTTQDWSTYARGEYITQHAAHMAIAARLDDGYREQELEPYDADAGIVARYWVGWVTRLNTEETAMVCSGWVEQVEADFTDYEIELLAAEAQADVLLNGDSQIDLLALETFMEERRAGLRQQIIEDAAERLNVALMQDSYGDGIAVAGDRRFWSYAELATAV